MAEPIEVAYETVATVVSTRVDNSVIGIHDIRDNHFGTGEAQAAISTATEVSGAAGLWGPAGAVGTPADLTAMAGITAVPETAWDEDSYMLLGDLSQVHWDSSAWVEGAGGAGGGGGGGGNGGCDDD